MRERFPQERTATRAPGSVLGAGSARRNPPPEWMRTYLPRMYDGPRTSARLPGNDVNAPRERCRTVLAGICGGHGSDVAPCWQGSAGAMGAMSHLAGRDLRGPWERCRTLLAG